MHGGRLEPSVHLFSFPDLVQSKRKNKVQREFVHQVGAGRRPITLAEPLPLGRRPLSRPVALHFAGGPQPRRAPPSSTDS